MTTEAGSSAGLLLEVSGLTIRYGDADAAVDGVGFSVAPGESVAIVGESGSGKSTTALSLIGLLPATATITSGTVLWRSETDLLGLAPRSLRELRGRRIGFIPQDPTVSLDPTQRVGAQVAESLEVHGIARGPAAREQAVGLLAEAGIDEPARRARQYPHQLSGGMRQRVLIAIAWACRPELIIADEPTSALDVTVQRQVLDRLDLLRREQGTALLFVTHDLGVAADRADRIVVMEQGRIVESGTAGQVLGCPRATYTRRLVASIPGRRDPDGARRLRASEGAEPLVIARNLVKEFAATRPDGSRFRFRAVDDVSLEIPRGRTLAIVGESGSGKSTMARLVMGLERATAGDVSFDGLDLGGLSNSRLRAARRRFQLIQQNPYSSLSPQWDVERIVAEPLRSFRVGDRSSRRARVVELLDRVGLPEGFASRRPHQLSGGQRQRVAIARALALSPDLVVCDEPVSALDVSVQAQILSLLRELQQDLGLAYLFISHDLAVVRELADEVAVMRHGQVVESGDAGTVFAEPRHEYTRGLIEAIPGRLAASR
ncbi:ABC transporter ATP-binding protein [Microbacterium betulae]|uniref:ABC transporter ATP-binding protein n=1 Tax=Microbacterium betulae TaxID=2981139 RepID=A0AA97FJ05_9MICO|nr:ABC transporter ATP-binding protein [Microbacterium sp. AB]WOF22914.1 ABC transporter ATP-binding protein [Microbacterium sp. AB]